MANALLWPIEVLSPRELLFDIAPRSLAGPSSISGAGQVSASDAGIWKVAYSGVPVINEQTILAWRAIDVLLEGRMNAVLVSLTWPYQPYLSEWEGAFAPVPHSDHSPFADGGMYQSRLIDIRLTSNIPLRGTAANIAIRVGANLQPGQHFSIGERLYRIRTVQMTGENTAAITFRPPAREAVSAGAEMEFDWPVCRMRLASDNEMSLPLDYNRWSFPTVNFIEDV